jgi:hypothetical protein
MAKRSLWLIWLWMLLTAFQLDAQQQKIANTAITSAENVGPWNGGAYSNRMIDEATSSISGSAPGKDDVLAVVWPPAKIDKVRNQANHFVANPPSEWLTGVITQQKVQDRVPPTGGDV